MTCLDGAEFGTECFSTTQKQTTSQVRERVEEGRIAFDHVAFAERVITLSEAERETLRLIAGGLSNKQIGRIGGKSESTVKHHVTRVMQKINATSRTEAAVKFALYLERCWTEREPAERSPARRETIGLAERT